jgi:hypothetical protein
VSPEAKEHNLMKSKLETMYKKAVVAQIRGALKAICMEEKDTTKTSDRIDDVEIQGDLLRGSKSQGRIFTFDRIHCE